MEYREQKSWISKLSDYIVFLGRFKLWIHIFEFNQLNIKVAHVILTLNSLNSRGSTHFLQLWLQLLVFLSLLDKDIKTPLAACPIK